MFYVYLCSYIIGDYKSAMVRIENSCAIYMHQERGQKSGKETLVLSLNCQRSSWMGV